MTFLELIGYVATMWVLANGVVLIKHPAAKTVATIPLVLLGLVGLLGATPVVINVGLSLIIAFGVYWIAQRRRWVFVTCSAIGAMVGVWLLFVYPTSLVASVNNRVRAVYPLESIAERLPVIPRSSAAQNLKAATADRLHQFQTSLAETDNRGRVALLRNLHEETNRVFEATAGLGYARMLGPTSWLPTDDRDDVPVLAQPGPRDTSSGSELPGIEGKALTAPSPEHDLHQTSLLDFLNPKQFGYVKSRDQVAGFRPHRFSKAPTTQAKYELQTLDLIGLLMHDQPVAYVSEHLPRMDELKNAPTRALDAFEAAGLAELRQGEDLYVRQNDSTLRMVGAIRAVKQCTTCHGCERGDLLGAFAYTLQKR